MLMRLLGQHDSGQQTVQAHVMMYSAWRRHVVLYGEWRRLVMLYDKPVKSHGLPPSWMGPDLPPPLGGGRHASKPCGSPVKDCAQDSGRECMSSRGTAYR